MIRYLLLLFSPIFFNLSAYADQVPISYSMRLIGDETRFRLLLDFDKPIIHRVYLRDDPRRLILDFSPSHFALDPHYIPKGASLVSKIQYGEIKEQGSRMALFLTSPIEIASVVTKPIASIENANETHHRLILDAVATAETELSISPQQSSSSTQPIDSPQPYTIVIDPGHGGNDGGAVAHNHASGQDTIEKFITLQFSKILREKLDENPNFKTVLTHEEDRFMSLAARRQVVQTHSADLFVSIHADAAPQGNPRGATFYTLSSKGSDELSRTLAQDHNADDLIGDLELSNDNIEQTVSDILIELARKETEQLSLQFAQLAISNFKDEVRLIRNPRRDANFAVLRNPYTPSILLELGYLSNEQDAQLLTMVEWQDKVAEILKDSIISFFAVREKSIKKSGILP